MQAATLEVMLNKSWMDVIFRLAEPFSDLSGLQSCFVPTFHKIIAKSVDSRFYISLHLMHPI